MPSPKEKFRIRGVGIDLVSIPRMRKFVKLHGKKAALLLDSSFSPRSKRPISVIHLARLFAAKEAVFKALGRSWMGMEGFRDIKVQGSPRQGFSVQCPFLPQGVAAAGRFFEGKDWAGAQVILWES